MRYLLIFLLLFPSSVLAAPYWQGRITWENDVIVHRDEWYTNGLELDFDAPDGNGPDGIQKWFLNHSLNGNGTTHYGFRFGQLMYTPRDIRISKLIEHDRPYAGWLYVGGSVVAENSTEWNQLSLDVGMVGPASFAEEIQKGVHKAINSKKPMGWDNQLRNEPGLLITWLWKKRISKLEVECGGVRCFDVIPRLSSHLGNVRLDYEFGGTIRGGWNVPNAFGPEKRIIPTASRRHWYENMTAYMLLGSTSRVVIRNIFLDGNSFTNSHSVGKRYFVNDFEAGLMLGYNEYMLGYTYVIRSPEFNRTRRWNGYGSLTLSTRF